MADPISIETQSDVRIITSDNPPVNALGAAVRIGIIRELRAALADDAIKAIVLCCAGRTFFAGADITEFTKLPVSPQLPELVDAIEASTKPVIAAIHGTALGGGCEVALGCHYRIAVPSAKIGTPEVKLGLLPGAGGTQRLPRVVGVAMAVEMCAGGAPVSAGKALEIGLIDKLAGEDALIGDAIAFATESIAKGPRPTRSLPVTGDGASIAAYAAANARKFRGFDAPAANIACVEAATRLPFDEGIRFEREQFTRLMAGSQSAAQRHIFFAERQANKIDGIGPDVKPRDIKRIGVIGAGTMGGGISMNFLSAGVPVTIVEMKAEALDKGVGLIRKNYEATAAKGRMSAEQVEAAMGALTLSVNLEDLADCDLIIEAVFEQMEIKKDIFGRLDKLAKPGAILASNTSYLDVDEIAASTSRPQDVLGMHFFSPANVMKLLEVVRGAKTAPDALLTAMGLAKKIGKVSVVAGVCYGFIGNRMLTPRQTEAVKLLLEGATPQQIDKVHTDFGMPMGPFQMADLAGVDIGWHRDSARIDTIRDALCAAGRWGQKTAKGWYDYDALRKPAPSKETQVIIEDFAARSGLPKRVISNEEIVERTLYPMVNEGHLILEEGKAQRASDIDVVWVNGYGWPVYRGGPMFWGDLEGATKIVSGLEKHGFAVAASLKAKAA